MIRGRATYRMREKLDDVGVAKSLGATLKEARKLMALPDFPRPTIESGKPKWDRAEIEHWYGTRWIRKRHKVGRPANSITGAW